MNERWMKDIQDRFADFEKPAPEGLLADVQREMQRRGLTPAEEKRGKLVPMWVKGAAVAASLAVVLGVGTLLLMNNEEVVNNYDVQAVVNELPDLETQPETQTHNIYNKTDLLAKQVEAQPVVSATYQDVVPVLEEVVVLQEEAVTQEETVVQNEASSETDDDTGTEKQVEDSKVEQTQTLPSRNNLKQSPTTYVPRPAVNRKSRKKWEIGASIAGMQGLSSPDYQYLLYGNLLSAKDMSYINSNAIVNHRTEVLAPDHPNYGTGVAAPDNPGYAGTGSFDGEVVPIGTPGGMQDSPTNVTNIGHNPNAGNPYSNYSSNYAYTRYMNYRMMSVNNQLTQVYMNAQHRQPVRIGLSLRYHFNEKWSLQAGIDYSYHSSDLIYQVANTQIQRGQKLHFLGVPVALSYTLWSPGKFNFYLSAGGEVEKVIKGSRDVLRLASNALDVADREDIDEKPWQFSVMGSGGMQFNINNLLSIYAEPGVAYYFDNKSVVPTIYQEKPFNFNLNLGLRFNIYGKQ
ncbi:MAG: porin family protein [Bacteroidaceae bacterium]|nr:porin family protein [Bacteroidaceae bacterium]